MLQCAAAVVQIQEQPHLNMNPQNGVINREAVTTAIPSRRQAVFVVMRMHPFKPACEVFGAKKQKAAPPTMSRLREA
jgi:hypothetical protein